MTNVNLKEKSEKELQKLLKDNREQLRKFRFGIAGAGNKKSRQPKAIRKEVAQVLTEINARNISK